MAVVMTANGRFRELALKRIAISRVADMLSAHIGIGLIAGFTRVGFRPMGTAATTRSLVFASARGTLLVTCPHPVVSFRGDDKTPRTNGSSYLHGPAGHASRAGR